MGFKEWYQRMKKENPEKLKEYRNKKQQRYRNKKKIEKRHKEASEINAQFKAGNLNVGIKLEAPKAISWKEFKNQHPDSDFWDFMDYKKSLRKPEIEKIELQSQKNNDYKRAMLNQVIMKMEGGELPDHVQTGFNFYGSEVKRTTLDTITEKENKIKAIIRQYYEKLKL